MGVIRLFESILCVSNKNLLRKKLFKDDTYVGQNVDYELPWVFVRVSWDVCTRYKRDSGCYYGRGCFLIGFLPYNPYKVGVRKSDLYAILKSCVFVVFS